MKKEFLKIHSYGNDFVLMKGDPIEKSKIQMICDRHYGIGADGMIFIQENPLTMMIFNQDGSLASMCGNGLRCFIDACYRYRLVDFNGYIQTIAQRIQFEIIKTSPFLTGYSLEVLKVNKKDDYYFIFIGTEHCICFEDFNLERAQELSERYYVNVDFVTVIDRETIKVKTYEKGVGVTLACGTGACASAYVTHMLKLCKSIINVEFDSGSVLCKITDESVWTQGFSNFVYEGVIEIEN